MRILGLDLSLTSTGYVLLDDQVLEDVVWHGCVGSKDLRDVERLQMFDTWIRDAMRPRVVDHVAIEGYSYGSPAGQTRAFGLGELGGVIKLAVHEAGIPMHVIAANTWKKQLCGKGGLKKDQVRLELFKRFGVEFASQDTLDAWAVAACLRRQLLGLDKPEPKVRKRKTTPLLDGISIGNPAMEAAHADASHASLR